jgi:hypothetical protein
MNELSRILSDGDTAIANWQNSDKGPLASSVIGFRNEYNVLRNRFEQFVTVNGQFSDFKVLEPIKMDKMMIYLSNLLDANSQFPDGASKSDWAAAIAPYVGPIKREIASLRQWVETAKRVAESSVLGLKARKQAGQ